MNRKQVYEVLKLLNDAYPQFKISQSKIDNWTKLLEDQDSVVVMRNAERYVLEHKYPPSLSDLREVRLASYSSNFLQTRKNWEREAVGYQPGS